MFSKVKVSIFYTSLQRDNRQSRHPFSLVDNNTYTQHTTVINKIRFKDVCARSLDSIDNNNTLTSPCRLEITTDTYFLKFHKINQTTTRMKLLVVGLLPLLATAFVTPHGAVTKSRQSLSSLDMYTASTIDISEMAPRDVYSMTEWAVGYGVQMAPGVELSSNDGVDFFLVANQGIPAGSAAVFVPAQLVLSSTNIQTEFSVALVQSEEVLQRNGATNRLPLFRLMVKILAEYEKGDQSPYFPWLNAMPRLFYNGVAMTGTELC